MSADARDISTATKPCTKCGGLKDVSEFGLRTSSKDGLSPSCKPCVRARNTRYYRADKERAALQRAKNYAKNRIRLLDYRRDYYARNRERVLGRQTALKRKNPELYRERGRAYAKNNREQINAYIRNRLVTDEGFRQKEAHRALLRGCLLRLGTKKTRRTLESLGYSSDKLAQRMSAQFKAGMSWSNYGEWHIDHKIPVAHFMKKGETRPALINALANLQPLWARENIIKRDKHPLRGPK